MSTAPNPEGPAPAVPAPARESLLPLWADPLEDATGPTCSDARRFLPEPWLLTPAERIISS